MPKYEVKQNKVINPIENHQTASWANIENLKPEANVPIPSELEVENAKRWVDTNEK